MSFSWDLKPIYGTYILLRHHTPIAQFLYDQLPSQCKQCGIRFADTSLGKQKMQDHLDMHFRQNRKAGQAVGRGHSRGWFVGIEVRILIPLFEL